MGWLFGLVLVFCSFIVLKYRGRIGDMIGDPQWVQFVGGIYIFLAFFSIFLFFWGVAEITGTTNILFTPIIWFIRSFFPEAPGGAEFL